MTTVVPMRPARLKPSESKDFLSSNSRAIFESIAHHTLVPLAACNSSGVPRSTRVELSQGLCWRYPLPRMLVAENCRQLSKILRRFLESPDAGDRAEKLTRDPLTPLERLGTFNGPLGLHTVADAEDVSATDAPAISEYPDVVILVTDQATLRQCLQAGDFPFRSLEALPNITTRQTEASQRFQRLTQRQTEILRHILTGEPNKNIAADLGISQRTVEAHRASIMARTRCKSLPDLVRLAARAGIQTAENEFPAAS